MAKRRTYRYRSHRQAPLTELLFVAVLMGVCVIAFLFSWVGTENLPLILSALFLIGLIFGGIFYSIVRRRLVVKRRALRALELSHVDAMTGEDFEDYVAELLRFQGYRVSKTRRSGDFGVDLLAELAGMRLAVQVKRYSKPVSLSAIQEVVAGKVMKEYRAHKIMVVTNQTFTASARLLAVANECELIDREKLSEWILLFSNQDRI